MGKLRTKLCDLNDYFNSLKKFRFYEIHTTYEVTRKENLERFKVNKGLKIDPTDNELKMAFEKKLNRFVFNFKESFNGKFSDEEIFKAIDIALLYDLVSFFKRKNDCYFDAGYSFSSLLKEHIEYKDKFNIIDETLNMIHLKYKDFLDEKEKEFDSLPNSEKEKFDNISILYAENELRKKVSLIPYDVFTLKSLENAEVCNQNGLFIRDKQKMIKEYLQDFITSECNILNCNKESCFIFLPNENDIFKAKYLLDELEYKTKLYIEKDTNQMIIACARNDFDMQETEEIASDWFNEYKPNAIHKIEKDKSVKKKLHR